MINPHALRENVQMRIFFRPYFPAFGLNTGKYGPEKTPYLDSFHAVHGLRRNYCSVL